MRRIFFIMLSVIAASRAAMGDALPGDLTIVPGVRIGAAELAPADQGALQRDLGQPDQTNRNGDHEYYRYGADELVIDFDLANDAPFEISTTSSLYHTREGGLGVGSNAAVIAATLGKPVCRGANDAGDEVIAYDLIWFLLRQGLVTRVSIRAHVDPGALGAGSIPCR
jgi:phosphohistidine swiveling domain-containing protein